MTRARFADSGVQRATGQLFSEIVSLALLIDDLFEIGQDSDFSATALQAIHGTAMKIGAIADAGAAAHGEGRTRSSHEGWCLGLRVDCALQQLAVGKALGAQAHAAPQTSKGGAA
jgi:hypothetical protein